MNKFWLLLGIVCLCGGTADFVQAETPPPPGTVVVQSPNERRNIGAPMVTRLADGAMYVSHDWFNDGFHNPTRMQTELYESLDSGKSWQKTCEIPKLGAASLFHIDTTLYILGRYNAEHLGKHRESIVILRSDDRGRTWTTPRDAHSGLLLDDAPYAMDPMGILFHAGRVWKEVQYRGEKTNPRWCSGDEAMVMSVAVDANLLEKSAWTFSNRLVRPENTPFNGWLEGTVVPAPDGSMKVLMRADEPKKGEVAAVLNLSTDGKNLTFDRTIPFPGGCVKFCIQYDEKSKKYWTLSNWVHPDDRDAPDKERTRNTLALCCSDDLLHWEVRSIVLRHRDLQFGFQYTDWFFDGDDLVFVCRTSWYGKNCHDSNFLTIHRVENFRTRTRNDDSPTW
ncbi:MAG: sialidase family protein [Planctomycetia bacterium]|nr:sialidase family protein [Planctomycetia bacterium]